MDSIIFDLDGTLWDSRETVVAGWKHVMEQYKSLKIEISSEDLKHTFGLPFDEVGRRLLPDLDEERQKTILNECCAMENLFLSEHGGILYKEVEEGLKTLSQQFQLYIVSNCQDGYIEAFFAYHDLGKYFRDYENPGRTGLSKAENIKLIIERNHLKAPVYVGDTEGDQKAAKQADIPFIYARYGFGEVANYDVVIDCFNDLTSVLKAF